MFKNENIVGNSGAVSASVAFVRVALLPLPLPVLLPLTMAASARCGNLGENVD